MKKLTLLLLVLCTCWLTSAAQAISGRYLTLQDALNEARKDHSYHDCDYYEMEASSDNHFMILVDADPTQPWPHEYYTYYVPTYKDVEGKHQTQKVKYSKSNPPKRNYIQALDVKNRMGDAAYLKPHIAKRSGLTQEEVEIASRTYAVIIAANPGQMCYTERIWNDCSLVYQTLAHHYGVPKSNIYPLMSDGTNAAADMRAMDGTLKSQSLDLDFDGTNEIQLAATKANIANTLTSLLPKLNEDDHLLVYIDGYGDYTTPYGDGYEGYLDLGNGEDLLEDDIANLISPFAAKYVNIDVVMAQDYGGGLADKLRLINGCVVTTATSPRESALYNGAYPYTRFTYDWASAMLGKYPHAGSIRTDVNGDGRVSIKEAYTYAAQFCAQSMPSYSSNPESVGEDLAFNHVAPAVDLYIKDNYADIGVEPNLTTINFWNSPSIWLRDNNDFGTEHQRPVLSNDNLADVIYVKIHNRGKAPYLNTKSQGFKYVHVYWSKAATCITQAGWKGYEEDDDGNITGDHIKGQKIDTVIAAGDSLIVFFNWALPSDKIFKSSQEQFCFLARILDQSRDGGIGEYSEVYFEPRDKKTHAQRNLAIYTSEDAAAGGIPIFIRNHIDRISDVSLEMVAARHIDTSLFEEANIEFKLSPLVLRAWQNGGFKCKNVRRLQSADEVRVMNQDNKIDAIKMGANAFDKVTLKINFNNLPSQEEYMYDLIQRDSDGKIVGGETFVIKAPQPAANALNISEAPADNGRRELVADMDGFATVRWKNSRGEDVGEEAALNVLATPDNNTFKAIAMTADGKIAVSDYTIETVQGIEAVSAVGDNVTVQLSDAAPAGASITIGAASGLGEKISAEVPAGAKELSISAQGLVNGINAVTLSVDDEKIDSKKFVK